MLRHVLIAAWGDKKKIVKNSEIGHVSIDYSTTSRGIAKQMAPLDSAHQIGLTTFLNDVLIID